VKVYSTCFIIASPRPPQRPSQAHSRKGVSSRGQSEGFNQLPTPPLALLSSMSFYENDKMLHSIKNTRCAVGMCVCVCVCVCVFYFFRRLFAEKSDDALLMDSMSELVADIARLPVASNPDNDALSTACLPSPFATGAGD
jgi:hypothetical protein